MTPLANPEPSVPDGSAKLLTNCFIMCIIYLLKSRPRPTSFRRGAHHVLFCFLIKVRLRRWKPGGLCLLLINHLQTISEQNEESIDVHVSEWFVDFSTFPCFHSGNLQRFESFCHKWYFLVFTSSVVSMLWDTIWYYL